MPDYKFKTIVKYFEEFLSTRKENIIPVREFTKFLESKGYSPRNISTLVLRLSAEGYLNLYRDVVHRYYIIKDPSKFNELEFFTNTQSVAAAAYTFLVVLIELQIKNPRQFINMKTVLAEHRKKYPNLRINAQTFRNVKNALFKLGYLEWTGTPAYPTLNVRLTDEFMKKYGELTIDKFKELLEEMKPYLSTAKDEDDQEKDL